MRRETPDHIRPAVSDGLLCCVVLLATLAVLFALAYPMLLGRIYVHNDLEYYSIPLRFFYKQCLTRGDNFSWMPSILCGHYAHGEGQMGMYHPAHFLMYRALPLDWAFNLELFMSFPLMFAGMFLFLRRWRLSRHAALFGAFVFTFSGFNLLHGIHIQAIEVIAHIPWLLFALDIAVRTNSRSTFGRAAVAIAFLTASQLLLGYPQYVYFSLLIESLYCAFLLYLCWSESRRSDEDKQFRLGSTAALVICAKALALLIAAVQVLPTLDLLGNVRCAEPDPGYSFICSLHPANLVQFVGPYFFQGYVGMLLTDPKHPHEAGLYNGVIASVLLVWVMMRYRRLRDCNETSGGSAGALALGALAFALFALVLALGEYGLLYRVAPYIPLLRSFRGPSRHIVLVHCCLGVLAGIAFADLSNVARGKDPIPWRRLWPLALPVAAGWVIAANILGVRMGIPGAWAPASAGPFLTSNKEVLISPVLMTVAVLLVLLAARGWRLALVAIVAFAAVDQAAYGLRYLRKEPPTSLASFVDGIGTPPTEDGDRVYALLNNQIVMRGFKNCGGYVGVELQRALSYDYHHKNVLRLAGVSWATASWPGRGYAFEWTEIEDPLPRARLVSHVMVSQDPAEDIEKVDLRTTALVSSPLDIPPGEPGHATILEDRPGVIRIRARTDSRQLLVVAESYYRGWTAWVNGAEQPVLRVYGDFMGCVVEHGTHEVVLRFQPKSLRIGRWLSCLGIALTLLLLPALSRYIP